MGFIALIVALLIEQGRSLPADNWVHRMVLALADLVRSSTDAGQRQHGLVGFVVLAVVMLAVVLVLDWLAGMVHPALRLLVHIAVLYFTLGFRQFSQTFTEMQVALAADDTPGARRVLDRWVAQNAADEGSDRPERDTSVHEICRRAIAHALVGAHRNVFGPLFGTSFCPVRSALSFIGLPSCCLSAGPSLPAKRLKRPGPRLRASACLP